MKNLHHLFLDKATKLNPQQQVGTVGAIVASRSDHEKGGYPENERDYEPEEIEQNRQDTLALALAHCAINGLEKPVIYQSPHDHRNYLDFTHRNEGLENFSNIQDAFNQLLPSPKALGHENIAESQAWLKDNIQCANERSNSALALAMGMNLEATQANLSLIFVAAERVDSIKDEPEVYQEVITLSEQIAAKYFREITQLLAENPQAKPNFAELEVVPKALEILGANPAPSRESIEQLKN